MTARTMTFLLGLRKIMMMMMMMSSQKIWKKNRAEGLPAFSSRENIKGTNNERLRKPNKRGAIVKSIAKGSNYYLAP